MPPLRVPTACRGCNKFWDSTLLRVGRPQCGPAPGGGGPAKKVGPGRPGPRGGSVRNAPAAKRVGAPQFVPRRCGGGPRELSPLWSDR